MQTIIIGREGDQQFQITADGVSRHHAKITIDNDRWTLEDLNSTHGTYIRNSDGDLRRVSRCEITPKTFITLGYSNAHGCSFYASHVLHPDNYSEEFFLLNEMNEDFERQIEVEESKAQRRSLVTPILYLLVFALSFYPFGTQVQLWIMRVPIFLGGIITYILSRNNGRKRLIERRGKFFTCPNPACNHKLSVADVRNQQCPRCHAR